MTKPEDIKIETVKVTLKAMVIGPRQLTQSIFKQLVNEDILDQDALTLRGQPWGYVNYLVNESPDVARYIVWQKGSELRRCIVKRVTAKHDSWIGLLEYEEQDWKWQRQRGTDIAPLQKQLRELSSYVERYDAVVEPLFELEQLFIAV